MSRECALRSLEPWRRAHEPPPEGVRLAQRLEDGKPFAYPAAPAPSSSAGGAVVLCLLPKVGSTTWKLALLSNLLPISRKRLLTRSPHRKRRMPRAGPPRELLRTVPRIIIVRDPYDRLLSGYLDKIVMQKIARLAPKPYKIGDGFAAFVGNLTQRPPEEANVHWRPQALQCGMDRGLSYDYVLPVEEMHRWYEPLVRVLGLVRTVSHGWNHSTRWFRGRDECFFAPPGRRCDGMFSSAGCFRRGVSDGGERSPGAPGVRPASFHATDAAELSRHGAYYTPYTLQLATTWLRRDLEALGYPVRT